MNVFEWWFTKLNLRRMFWLTPPQFITDSILAENTRSKCSRLGCQRCLPNTHAHILWPPSWCYTTRINLQSRSVVYRRPKKIRILYRMPKKRIYVNYSAVLQSASNQELTRSSRANRCGRRWEGSATSLHSRKFQLVSVSSSTKNGTRTCAHLWMKGRDGAIRNRELRPSPLRGKCGDHHSPFFEKVNGDERGWLFPEDVNEANKRRWRDGTPVYFAKPYTKHCRPYRLSRVLLIAWFVHNNVSYIDILALPL